MKFSWVGFPLSKHKFRKLAWEYAEVNGLKGFSLKQKKAGRKWLKSFLNRHPQLHPKKSKNISVNRAMCANPTTVQKFFNQYAQLLKDKNVDSPYYIWNCDESGVQDIPKEEEVIGVVNEKANSQVPSEHGETSTVLTFANVCGQVMPPLIIHKGKQVGKTWTIGASRDVIVHASAKGYINKDIFFEYAECWVQYLRRKSRLDKTNILLLDAHNATFTTWSLSGWWWKITLRC